jgi:CDP-glycerol glycerophosphotransferase (TagB/SpsB family)
VIRRLARSAVWWLGIAAVRVGFLLGRIGAPRKRVVFATRDADHPGGNLVAIRAELARRAPTIRTRVIGYRMRSGLGGRVATAVEAVRLGYHLASARLLVADDWLFPLYAAWPRAGTTRVQVWHAAGAFKAFGFSVADADAVGQLPMTANFDLVLASSEAAKGPFAHAFRVPPERVTSAIGIPRTDLFFDPAARATAEAAVRDRFGLEPRRKVVLYAPTFRGAGPRDAHDAGLLDIGGLHAALGDGWTLLLRLHPLVAAAAPIPHGDAGFAVDASGWPDMNELLLVADVLVTDYSSVAFEFALLGRPMAFLAPDADAYTGERGFYLDLRSDLPGPVVATTAELAAHLLEGAFDAEATRAFARRWFDVADGHASERFVERIVLPAVRGDPPAIDTAP